MKLLSSIGHCEVWEFCSTVSSGVNSIVLVLTEDFIKPLHDGRKRRPLTEQTVMKITKGLCELAIGFKNPFFSLHSPECILVFSREMFFVSAFLIGFVAIGLAFVASALGRGLIQFCLSIDGMCGGPLLGLFFCGMLLPFCNTKVGFSFDGWSFHQKHFTWCSSKFNFRTFTQFKPL